MVETEEQCETNWSKACSSSMNNIAVEFTEHTKRTHAHPTNAQLVLTDSPDGVSLALRMYYIATVIWLEFQINFVVV